MEYLGRYSISYSPKCLRRVSLLWGDLRCHPIHGLLAIGGPEDRVIPLFENDAAPAITLHIRSLNGHGSGHVESVRIALVSKAVNLGMNNDVRLKARRNKSDKPPRNGSCPANSCLPWL